MILIITIHLLDNHLVYKINNSEHKIVNSILTKGRINNLEKFVNTIIGIMKANNINKGLKFEELTLIHNDLYNFSDIKKIEKIFRELFFKKINFIKESDILKNANYIINDIESTRIFQKNKEPTIIYNNIFVNEIKNIINEELYYINIKKENSIIKTKNQYVYINPYTAVLIVLSTYN